MKNDEVNSVIDSLKPVIDELADAAYERRPDVAAVRARAYASAPSPRAVRKWRPVIVAGTATVAAAAVVVATVTLSGAGKAAAGAAPEGMRRSIRVRSCWPVR